MKDRADYARKGIARGRSRGRHDLRRRHPVRRGEPVPGAAQDQRDLRPDRLRRGRQVQRVREPAHRRRPARRPARATPTTAATSPAGGWPTPTPRRSARSSPSGGKPYEVEIVVAEVGDDRRRRPDLPADLRRLGGRGAAASRSWAARPTRSTSVPGAHSARRAALEALHAAVDALGQDGTGSRARWRRSQLEVAVLDRHPPQARKFRRVSRRALARLLGGDGAAGARDGRRREDGDGRRGQAAATPTAAAATPTAGDTGPPGRKRRPAEHGDVQRRRRRRRSARTTGRPSRRRWPRRCRGRAVAESTG